MGGVTGGGDRGVLRYCLSGRRGMGVVLASTCINTYCMHLEDFDLVCTHDFDDFTAFCEGGCMRHNIFIFLRTGG